MRSQLSRLVALVLALWLSSWELTRSNLFSSILDINEVCPPDSFTCPHGGLAFRDRNHGCEFTPCEFVKPPTFAPTPAPVNPRTTNASRWFRNREFFIPRVRFRELKRGSNLAKRVTESLQVKSRRASQFVDLGESTGCVDLYAVANQFTPKEQTSENASMRHESLLIEALSTGGDLMRAECGSLLVTFWKPWTRFALFGWLTQHPSVRGILTMLRHVQELNSLEGLMKRPLARAHDVLQAAAEATSQQIIALPSLVIMNATDVDGVKSTRTKDNASDGTRPGWVAEQPEAVQVEVFEFLEQHLLKLGHLELPARRRPGTNLTKADVEKNEDANRSVGFAPRYGKSSASVVAFLTPFSSLLHGESGAKVHASLWNFTMLTCNEHDTRLRAHPNAPLTELVASSRRNTPTGGCHTCSCWFYQQVEDLNGARLAATTTHAVRFCHSD